MYNFYLIHSHAKKLYLHFFDIVDTAFSCERELIVCSFPQDFFKGKGSRLQLIFNEHTAFLLCGAAVRSVYCMTAERHRESLKYLGESLVSGALWMIRYFRFHQCCRTTIISIIGRIRFPRAHWVYNLWGIHAMIVINSQSLWITLMKQISNEQILFKSVPGGIALFI